MDTKFWLFLKISDRNNNDKEIETYSVSIINQNKYKQNSQYVQSG